MKFRPLGKIGFETSETGTAIIVRMTCDEGVLTGKYGPDTTFPEGDFRSSYFEGDRIARASARAEEVRSDLDGSGLTMPQAAVKFSLSHPAVSVVIPGMRNRAQAKANCAVSDLADLNPELLTRLQRHNWRRAIWYSGK